MALLKAKRVFLIKILQQGDQEFVFYNDVREQSRNHVTSP